MRKAIVTATIELKDGTVQYKTYSSTSLSISALKREIRKIWKAKPETKYVLCGNGIYQNSYGAH